MATALVLLCAATVIALPAQTFTTLVNFDGSNGAGPVYMALIQGTDGKLYGTTTAGGIGGYGTVFKMTRQGTLTTLHSFAMTDGSHPEGALVQATNGSFYGTASLGGVNGSGTVFEITPQGTFSTKQFQSHPRG